eukprot:TRINITY_DN1052_c0_g1_i2.p2 TRINITY_DN1052_c0_g1~~TRINITY_DN1052_c0_g1_i2.p2  ORF type:complete len:419 (+),score=106.93 TRINITY_DN1052_c0_g1_i2:89-1345(+)
MLSTARISSAVYSNIRLTQAFRKTSYWAHIEKAPEDAIFGITNAFNQDKSPLKINLGVGAYRDDKGKPWILPSVREAEKRLHESGLDHEYAAINGIAAFTKAAAKLAYGEQSGCIQENRVAVAQSISGTGALRIGAAFLNQFMKDKSGAVYIPNPTWPNHVNVFQSSGFKVNRYRYYDPRTKKVDMDGLIHDIRDAPKNSVFLLHACAHNPTGVDPTMGQWEDLMKELKKSGHLCFFDSAYQGFASGDPDRDAQAIRMFVDNQLPVVLAQSFAKNFGLYGERVGTFSVVTANPTEALHVDTQIRTIVRPMYSNPPLHGARLVSLILNDEQLKHQWLQDVKTMAHRIIRVRADLKNKLAEAGSKRDWTHITDQIGMFCFSGLDTAQVCNVTPINIESNIPREAESRGTWDMKTLNARKK